jgi:hypothetical protein
LGARAPAPPTGSAPDICRPIAPTDVDASVDIYVAATPSGPITDRRTYEHAREKGRSRGVVDRTRSCVIDRGRCVDNGGWLVGRYVNDLRIGRHNFDHFLFHYDDLLVIGFQIADGLGLSAELLDGAHDIFLLVDHGVTQFLGPVEVLVHHIDDFGIVE